MTEDQDAKNINLHAEIMNQGREDMSQGAGTVDLDADPMNQAFKNMNQGAETINQAVKNIKHEIG